MRVELFKYAVLNHLFVEVLLNDVNNDSNREQYFTHTWRGVPFTITDESYVDAFLKVELWEVVRRTFPNIESFNFTLENYELYRKRVGSARIHMKGNDYKFTINGDGQWQVACKNLNSGTIQDYNLMFNKLNELSDTIQGR